MFSKMEHFPCFLLEHVLIYTVAVCSLESGTALVMSEICETSRIVNYTSLEKMSVKKPVADNKMYLDKQ